MRSHRHSVTSAAAILVFFAALAGSIGPACSAEENPKPPAYGDAAHDLPLKAYKELRVLWEAATGLFDFKSPAASELPDGVKSQDTAKAALAKAVAENREQLVRALTASQALHRELAAKLLPRGGEPKVVVEALAKGSGP